MKNFVLKISTFLLILSLFAINNTKAQSNQYLNFDGVDDWVSVANASALIANSTAFSMTGWFNNSALAYGQGYIGFRTSTQSFNLAELGTGILNCYFGNSAGASWQLHSPSNTVIPNMWQHFAMVYDGSTVKLYCDSILVADTTVTGTFTATTIPFAIGRSTVPGSNFYFKGDIDEVTLWNKVLTQTDIHNIMQHELGGTEANLLLYYKFNQGVPGGNNTSITTLHNEVAANSPLYDGVLNTFALTGATSNFEGSLDTSFQTISFPTIQTKLTTSSPFKLTATATSGLPVSYTLISGPATIINDTVHLAGTAGTVVIKAYQNGSSAYDTAAPITNSFDVVDPNLNVPIIDARHPLAGNVYMPTLSKIQLAAIATINYTDLFSVQELHFKIDGSDSITSSNFNNGHYTAWWLPTSYGNHVIVISAKNNFGAIATTTVNINIVANATDTTVQAFSGVINYSSVANEVDIDGELPSYIGAYDTIIATLTVTCPTSGCGAWDYIRSVDARTHEGNWFEIIRYITPYGVPCSHQINLADYMSILCGKVSFRVVGLDNGYLYSLSFTFKAGAPPHKYSQVSQLWRSNYDFGNYANQQPVSVFNYTFPTGTIASKIKLISTGHGGPNNTGNAAEFYEATHHIHVNNVDSFAQHNWTICNPNPDNCSSQLGTWQYNRAGWCPGTIAKPFDYDLSTYIPSNNVAIKYVFMPSYIDQCNPNYPPCVTNSTCTDCSADVQPYLDVDCNLINFFDSPPANPVVPAVNELKSFKLAVYPNPSTGIFNLTANNRPDNVCDVKIYNMMGNVVKEFQWNGENTSFNLSNNASGVYIMKVSNKDNVEVKKLMLR